MILTTQHAVRGRITETLSRVYGLEPGAMPPLAIEYPPNRAMGDLALPVAFELARRLRKAPKAIAQELVAELGSIGGIARIEAAPNGYINFYLSRAEFLAERLAAGDAAVTAAGDRPKVIVEHTAINPNKAAHVGHLRNSSLGDTLVRLLRFRGSRVEVQNYIDDTGVQLADVVVGFLHLESEDFAGIRRIADTTRFDYYCWDLYARVTDWYEADKERLAIRAHALHEIEKDEGEIAAIGHFIADRIVRRHLETMGRLSVDYDLLTWEGDILRLRFWAQAFEILKKVGAVFLQTEGKLAGCWVMRIDEEPGSDAPDANPDEESEAKEKVIVRSNGTVTYVGKDIAYQFWKFGLLGKDFYYRVFDRRADGTPLWATSAEPPSPDTPPHPPFGAANAVYNVIDTRQAYLQKLLKQALATMGYVGEAERSTHFSYEMVALSLPTARELGYASADEEGRAFVEVSGRKGLGVKADDLLDRLMEKASSEVARRNPEFSPEDCRRTGEIIATAALRYFMIKFSRGKVIVFDMDEALSFEGESGPYLQYAAVRVQNIFQKLKDRAGLDEPGLIASLPALDSAPLDSGSEADDLWALVLEASRLDEIADNAIRTLELAVLAKWAFGLAQMFNGFYHRYPILNEERDEVRRWRAAAAAYFKLQIGRALELMGSGVPVRM